MPVITLEISPMSAEKKAEIAKIFTEELSRVSGLPKEAIVILFHENTFENIASGGVMLSERK